jgi:hypothetical protein
VSLPALPKTEIDVVLATVGVPPLTGTAPPLTRMFPAASRLTEMALSTALPFTVRTPAANEAETPFTAFGAACAGRPAMPIVPAPTRAPMNSRPALRRRANVRLPDIVVSMFRLPAADRPNHAPLRTTPRCGSRMRRTTHERPGTFRGFPASSVPGRGGTPPRRCR